MRRIELPTPALVALAFVFATIVSLAFSGCNGDGDLSPYCAGNVAFWYDRTEGISLQRRDCGAEGLSCREFEGGAECVDLTRPCTVDVCDTRNSYAMCGQSGFFGGPSDTFTCVDSRQTCLDAQSGAVCVYSSVSCPSSDADKFCASDRTGYYAGCSAKLGVPTQFVACDFGCEGRGLVCAEGTGGALACIHPDLIPCGNYPEWTCSADGAIKFLCSQTGYVGCYQTCSLPGQSCRVGNSRAYCSYDVSCAQGEVSKCSADGKSVYGCFYGFNSYADSNTLCVPGSVCHQQTTEEPSGTVTRATCVPQ
jgi:hypothetical protein